MSRKHPLVAAIETRIEDRKIEISQLETQMFQLKDRRNTLDELQEEDIRLLAAASTPKSPRVKKIQEPKDGG